MSVIQFDIPDDYHQLLIQIKSWVMTKPICDHVIFHDNYSFKPQFIHAQKFDVNPSKPYGFIHTIPENLKRDLFQLFTKNWPYNHSLHVDNLRIFCNALDLPWHTDAPYRRKAINLAVSDVLGDTKSVFSFKDDNEVKNFRYEYGKAYIVDIEADHQLCTQFINTDIRIAVTLNINDM